MKAVIIDDDPDCRKVLKILMKRYFKEVTIVGEADSVKQGVAIINSLLPDLVMLDIQIINGTGFDILDQLDYDPLVVFITSHDNYALQAIKAEACDYILKPVVEQEFIESVLRCKRRFDAQQFGVNVNFEKKHFISLPGTPDVFVNTDDVIYFESFGAYTNCFLQNQKLVVSCHLGEIERKLPKQKFIRTHRKHLINIEKVSHFEIENRTGEIVLIDKTKIRLSARKIGEFKKIMNIL